MLMMPSTGRTDAGGRAQCPVASRLRFQQTPLETYKSIRPESYDIQVDAALAGPQIEF